MTDWLTVRVLLFWPYWQLLQCFSLFNYSVLWYPSKTMSTDAAQYTADCYQVASPRITQSDSEGNLTHRLQTLFCSTLTLEHWDCPEVCLGVGTTITRPLLCRAPVRWGLLRLSWWGWSRRAPILLWRGRRDSALPLFPSVQTESCRSCCRWQVPVLLLS